MAWIDYRNEMDVLINGRNTDIGQGYWIIYRLSLIGSYTEFWNPATQTAEGGPKWNYVDIPMKCIDKPYSVFTGKKDDDEAMFNAGLDNLETRVFGIEFKSFMDNPLIPQNIRRYPCKEDFIYSIDKHAGRRPPRNPIKVLDRYKVLHKELVHGDNGQVELFYCFGQRIHGEV